MSARPQWCRDSPLLVIPAIGRIIQSETALYRRCWPTEGDVIIFFPELSWFGRAAVYLNTLYAR